MKILLGSVAIAVLGLTSGLWADAKGMGYDIITSIPISDPDNVSDEGSYGLDVTSSAGGDRSNLSVNVKYELYKFGAKSNMNINFLAYQYDWENSQSSVSAKELQLSLYYARSVFKSRDESGAMDWRPASWSLGYYFGMGIASSKIDVDIPITVPQASVVELNGLRGGTNFDGSKGQYSVPFNFGLVGNLSLSRRHGVEVFGNIDQHVEIDDAAFGSYAPTLNVGGIYHFRLSPEHLFPTELSFGVILSALNNDIEDGQALNFMLGIRKRF